MFQCLISYNKEKDKKLLRLAAETVSGTIEVRALNLNYLQTQPFKSCVESEKSFQSSFHAYHRLQLYWHQAVYNYFKKTYLINRYI